MSLCDITVVIQEALTEEQRLHITDMFGECSIETHEAGEGTFVSIEVEGETEDTLTEDYIMVALCDIFGDKPWHVEEVEYQ